MIEEFGLRVFLIFRKELGVPFFLNRAYVLPSVSSQKRVLSE